MSIITIRLEFLSVISDKKNINLPKGPVFRAVHWLT